MFHAADSVLQTVSVSWKLLENDLDSVAGWVDNN